MDVMQFPARFPRPLKKDGVSPEIQKRTHIRVFHGQSETNRKNNSRLNNMKTRKSITMVLAICCFLLIFSTSYAADKWDHVDLVFAGTFVLGQAINYAHINETVNNEYWHEINPLMPAKNTTELIAWKTGSTLLILGIAHILPSKWRKALLGSANAVVWGFVIHDFGVGVSMRW